MRIIDSMRKQAAIYWPPATSGDYGEQSHGALVELVQTGTGNYRVRWEGKTEEFQAPDGSVQRSMALVYVPQLPGGGEVQVGGYLWLGVRGDLTDEVDPRANPGAYEVRRFDTLPTLKANKTLRTAYL